MSPGRPLEEARYGTDRTHEVRRPDLASTRTLVGGVVWATVPLLTLGTPIAAGSLEHLFLLMPLVVAPLALALLADLLTEDGAAPSPLFAFARAVQPGAAVFLVLSFAFTSGRAAGMLALPWLAMALTLAASGVSQLARGPRAGFHTANLLAAQAFLVVAAAWLLLWRLGVGPRNLSPLLVSLAAVHFHFNGFAAQVLIGATGRRLTKAPTPLRATHRIVGVAAIGGLPLLAVGKAFALPVARIAGVGAMTLALLGLSVTMTAVARAERSAAARALLFLSAASGAAGVWLAAAFGAGELVHREWISIGTMLRGHGALMAIGFTLCGMAGHLRRGRARLPHRDRSGPDA